MAGSKEKTIKELNGWTPNPLEHLYWGFDNAKNTAFLLPGNGNMMLCSDKPRNQQEGWCGSLNCSINYIPIEWYWGQIPDEPKNFLIDKMKKVLGEQYKVESENIPGELSYNIPEIKDLRRIIQQHYSSKTDNRLGCGAAEMQIDLHISCGSIYTEHYNATIPSRAGTKTIFSVGANDSRLIPREQVHENPWHSALEELNYVVISYTRTHGTSSIETAKFEYAVPVDVFLLQTAK
jgi:hypothetical protein